MAFKNLAIFVALLSLGFVPETMAFSCAADALKPESSDTSLKSAITDADLIGIFQIQNSPKWIDSNKVPLGVAKAELTLKPIELIKGNRRASFQHEFLTISNGNAPPKKGQKFIAVLKSEDLKSFRTISDPCGQILFIPLDTSKGTWDRIREKVKSPH